MATQYGEDREILRYFQGRTGRFLDVGAGDGLTFSNTEPLLRAGWSGIMIEPAISNLKWLIENHGDNPNVDIVPVAIAELGLQTLYDSREYSSTLASHQARIQFGDPSRVFRHRVICGVRWRDLGIERAQFDFVNIDVEGLNRDVLAGMVLNFAPRPDMVCVELDPESALPEMIGLLGGIGLIHIKRVGGNLLAARKEIL